MLGFDAQSSFLAHLLCTSDLKAIARVPVSTLYATAMCLSGYVVGL